MYYVREHFDICVIGILIVGIREPRQQGFGMSRLRPLIVILYPPSGSKILNERISAAPRHLNEF